jgi:hypothetical protein
VHAVGTHGRHPEEAQTVWQRALDLADPLERSAPLAGVIDLLSAAPHDSTTLAHALALGRTRLRGSADAIGFARAVELLARAVDFLGVRPEQYAARADVCRGA